MSATRAAELAKKVSEDASLKASLAGAADGDEAQKIWTEAGFGDVTKEDMNALASGELSDDQLGAAAGAGSTGAIIGSAAEDLYDWWTRP